MLWIVGFGVFRGSPARQMLAFSAVGVLYLLQPLVYGTSFPYISRLGVFLAIPLLLCYNGRRGRRSKLIQWGFYWFYPAHLLLLRSARLSGVTRKARAAAWAFLCFETAKEASRVACLFLLVEISGIEPLTS